MARTYVWSKCPYCNKTLSVSSHQGTLPESKIGKTEFILCPNCHGKVSNGKKEWKEMSSGEHFSEILLFIVSDLISVIIFSPIIGFIIYKVINFDSINYFFIISSIIAILLMVLFVFYNKKIINASNKRYSTNIGS